jgi:hypothetical protein
MAGVHPGGGLAILVHVSIRYSIIDTSLFSATDQICEGQAIQVSIGGVKTDIFNLYIPPASASPNYFNAHHAEWFSTHNDSLGDFLVDTVESIGGLYFLNGNSSTRLPRAANQSPSSPDVSLPSDHLVTSITWSTQCTL